MCIVVLYVTKVLRPLDPHRLDGELHEVADGRRLI